MTSYSLCLFIFHIFSHKMINFTVKFTINYTRMLRMREQSVASSFRGLLKRLFANLKRRIAVHDAMLRACANDT